MGSCWGSTLKLLNTVSSTAAMINHSSKFFPISDKGVTSYVAEEQRLLK